jgi:hypothetical protein
MVELTMPDLAAAMRAAVRGLVGRLDTEQRRQLVFPFDGDMHKRWTYLPGQRPGLRLGDLSDEQLEPALGLLQLVHSVRGWSDTQLVIRIEAVRRELSLQQPGRAGVDPYRDLPYWLVVLGDPTSTDPWAWRINGHHLLAQATVVGDQVNGVPHFFGAEPVDVCNAVSLAYAIPIAVFDLDQVTGNLTVRHATGTETYATFAGDTETPEAGEVIFADDAGHAHARRWTNRQSGRSAIRPETHVVLIVSEAMHDTGQHDVNALREELREALTLCWTVTT